MTPRIPSSTGSIIFDRPTRAVKCYGCGVQRIPTHMARLGQGLYCHPPHLANVGDTCYSRAKFLRGSNFPGVQL